MARVSTNLFELQEKYRIKQALIKKAQQKYAGLEACRRNVRKCNNKKLAYC